MSNRSGRGTCLYWLIVVLAFGATTMMLRVYTPVEATMGPIQKIFYLHLPSAICAFLACMVAFIGGVGYLWQRRMVWDDLSSAAAKVAALMCTVVLTTGMIWGRITWGKWWTWSPRLTSSLLLWLLYVVYLIIRPSIKSRSRRALICSVYVVAAFLDVPLVYLSARLIPDHIHRGSVTLEASSMKITLAAWFIPVTLLAAGLIVAWARKYRRQRERELETSSESTWQVPDPQTTDTQ
jgi:heme exporter protein C